MLGLSFAALAGVALALVLSAGCAGASTEVRGVISENTVWTAENGPYVLTGNLLVENGAALYIQPGTEVDLNGFFIQVDGTLRAAGTPENPVRFAGTSSSYEGNRLYFTPGSVGVIEHAGLEVNCSSYGGINIEAGASVTVRNCSVVNSVYDSFWIYGDLVIDNCFVSGRILCSGGSPLISNSVITDPSRTGEAVYITDGSARVENNLIVKTTLYGYGGGIRIDGGSPTVIGNTITANSNGIALIGSAGRSGTPVITRNNIYGNTNYNLFLYEWEDNVVAENNWWGTTDGGLIAQGIWDREDDFRLGVVDYFPYLSAPVPVHGTYLENLFLSPVSLEVEAGGSGTSAVTVGVIGAESPVVLEVSGPPGLDVSLDPNPVPVPSDGSATSSLEVRVSPETPPGTYTLTVTARVGLMEKSRSLVVEVPKERSRLSIAPSSFTLRPGQSITLTAELTDEDGNPLPGRTVTWTATVGELSVTSSTTDESGRASVVYTAPSAETSVTVTASFSGDNFYEASSASVSGDVGAATGTTVSVSPASFSLRSSESVTLTATLVDDAGNPLAGRVLRWEADAGTLSAASTLTDALGQASVTYTAPEVGSEVSVTITVSFAGDENHSGSRSTSTGIVLPAVTATRLSVSLPEFSVASGASQTLTLLLLDENGAGVGGRVISLTASAGSVEPDNLVTDASGRATAVFTAPPVLTPTYVTITATFAGDQRYTGSSASVTVLVAAPEVVEEAEQLRENLENRMSELEILVGEMENRLRALETAFIEGRLGASLSIRLEQGTHRVVREFQHEVEVRVKNVSVGNRVDIEVSSEAAGGKTVLVNLDSGVLADLGSARVLFDNQEIPMADDYADVLNPDDDNSAEYLILVGAKGAQVLVSIPGFSTHTITITTLPTQPVAQLPPLGVAVFGGIALVAAVAFIVWRNLRRGAEAGLQP